MGERERVRYVRKEQGTAGFKSKNENRRIPYEKRNEMLDTEMLSLKVNIIQEMRKNRIPRKARAIASSISADVSAVNHCLYGELNRYVVRDDGYRWRLKGTELPKSNNGIFYIYDYIPYRWWRWRTEEELEPTKAILDYKKGEESAIESFTEELLQVIDGILLQEARTTVVLVAAVPPSKVSSFSPVRESIRRIFSSYTLPGFAVIGCEGLLERVEDVSSAHSRGPRPSRLEQKLSIECTQYKLCTRDTSCLLIDDVTTTGRIMSVCREILVDNGMPKENIMRLALAKTE